MGEYEELDDSKLPELREQIEQIKQSIIESQNIIDATHTVTRSYEDNQGKTIHYSVTEYVYSASARRAAKEYINQATITLREIEKEIVKLEGLPIILAQAEQIVNDALSEIYNNYGVKASNAVCGKEVTYVPPANTNYSAPALPTHNAWNYKKDIPEGKLDLGQFYMRPELVTKYGSYDDYLNGVEKENNPIYNKDMEDNGIEPGEDPNATPEDTEPEVPEDTTPEEDTEQPDTDTPVEEDKPDEPSEPTEPDKPSEPSQPENPSQPSEPDKPSQPTTPSKPDTPNGTTKPNTPTIPIIPDDEGDTGVSDIPIIPDESLPSDGDNVIGDNNNQDIPPIIEIPDNNNQNDIIDITPPGNDEMPNTNDDKSSDLIKTIGIVSGVGAAVGAAALGAHTISKAKKNDMYEDDEE